MSSTNTKHVMISYNWGHQKEAIMIQTILKKKGFPVWLDIDNGIKEGDVNVAMADGVDGAAIIVCLASSKYELSKNCRKELSYADVKNVPIFPCLVEDGYVGNGWLGIIISPLLYYDFRGDRVGKGLVEAMQKKLGDDSATFKKESDIEKTRRNKRIFNQFFRGKVYTINQENCDMMTAEDSSKGIRWEHSRQSLIFKSLDEIYLDWHWAEDDWNKKYSDTNYSHVFKKTDGSEVDCDYYFRIPFTKIEFPEDRVCYLEMDQSVLGIKQYSRGYKTLLVRRYITLSEDLKVIKSGKQVTEIDGEVDYQTSYEHDYKPNQPINKEIYKTSKIYELDIENSKPEDEVKAEIELEEREEKLLQSDYLDKFVELQMESKQKLDDFERLQTENRELKNECEELKRSAERSAERHKTEILEVKKENERLKYKLNKQE